MKEVSERIDMLISKYLDKMASEQETDELLEWIKSDANHDAYFHDISRQRVSRLSSEIMADSSIECDEEKKKKMDATVFTSPKLGLYAALITVGLTSGGAAWWYFQLQMGNHVQKESLVEESFKDIDSIADSVFHVR